MSDEVYCDGCGSHNVTGSVEPVTNAPMGKRYVFTCGDCYMAWATTEMSILEALLIARA